MLTLRVNSFRVLRLLQTADGLMLELHFGLVSQIASRKTYRLFKIPVDADELVAVIETIVRASRSKAPFLASTINLYFLIAA